MNSRPGPRLAVFGATGAVGGLVCRLLCERQFPLQSIRFFGSPDRSSGEDKARTVQFGDQDFPVEPLRADAVRDIDLAIASTPDEVASNCAAWVVGQGGVLVDESAAHRMRDDVPLVVPEVNGRVLASHRGIIASPNCSTTQLVMCLQPIEREFGIKRIVVSTYQAASGAGNAARRELLDGSRQLLSGQEPVNREFESPLPFNLWPKIGSIRQDGCTSEEVKMVEESRKILQLPDLKMSVTCVRVPVENCHSESVVVETRRPVSSESATAVLNDAPGVVVMDDAASMKLPTPRNCHDRDEVFVGRIRQDPSVENGIAFWCVSDNLRKGAATNAVQIAQALVDQHLLR